MTGPRQPYSYEHPDAPRVNEYDPSATGFAVRYRATKPEAVAAQHYAEHGAKQAEAARLKQRDRSDADQLLDALFNEQEKNHALISALENRLEPVLTYEVAVPEGATGPCAGVPGGGPNSSPLLDRIGERIGTAQAANDRLVRLLHRLVV